MEKELERNITEHTRVTGLGERWEVSHKDGGKHWGQRRHVSGRKGTWAEEPGPGERTMPLFKRLRTLMQSSKSSGALASAVCCT